MTVISFDIYQTLAIAVVAMVVGYFAKMHIGFLDRFCIPSPVIGGIVVSAILCVLYETGVAEITFNDSLREVCMVFFFTSVGFQADFRLLKRGGKNLLVFLLLVIGLVFVQNALSAGSAMLFGMDRLLGLCTGSIPMTGGHGTSAAFGPILEERGLENATTICLACATYGLIAGSIIGGPIANRLIEKKNLLATVSGFDPYEDSALVMPKHDGVAGYSIAAFQMAVAAGIGTAISALLSRTGMTFPVYIGA
nr:sodium:glutamate symporter [Lachnospiraceae bacterium]